MGSGFGRRNRPDLHADLVLSEDGELALVRAAPEQFTEVARFAITVPGD